MLTDALYLNAAWATPVPAAETGPGPFTTAAGTAGQRAVHERRPVASASASGWTAVWLPYGGGRLAMMALLPPAGPRRLRVPDRDATRLTTTRLAAGGTDRVRPAAHP